MGSYLNIVEYKLILSHKTQKRGKCSYLNIVEYKFHYQLLQMEFLQVRSYLNIVEYKC